MKKYVTVSKGSITIRVGRLEVSVNTPSYLWRLDRDFAFTVRNRLYVGLWVGGVNIQLDRK